MDTAQAGDGLLVQLFGKSWGFQVLPAPAFVTWSAETYCGDNIQPSHCIPFSSWDGAPNIGCVISAGYMLAATLMMPLGFLSLDDNIKFQIASFWILAFLKEEGRVGPFGRAGRNSNMSCSSHIVISIVDSTGDSHSSIIHTLC